LRVLRAKEEEEEQKRAEIEAELKA